MKHERNLLTETVPDGTEEATEISPSAETSATEASAAATEPNSAATEPNSASENFEAAKEGEAAEISAEQEAQGTECGERQESGKEDRQRKYLRDLCYVALFAAVLTVCSWIAIPISEISITLQTMGVCMAAGFLGWKRGTLCVVVYILLGVCCVPVFSNFKNFYALIGSASAGYVIGFIFTALIVGFASDRLHLVGERYTDKVKSQLLQLVVLAAAMVVGVAVCYVFGTLWYLLIYKGSVTADYLQIALTYCVYPYLLPDFIKIVIATVLVNRLKRFVE